MTAQRPRPDFLQPVARPGLLAWAWCGTGLLVLLVSALEARAAWVQQQASLQRQALAARPQRPAEVAPAERQAGAQRSLEARRWRQRLAQPWPALWSASELASSAAQGHLAWLSWTQDDNGQLRLAGQVHDAALAEAAAAALRQQTLGPGNRPAPRWASVRVASMERTPEGQRFEIEAQLASPPGAAP